MGCLGLSRLRMAALSFFVTCFGLADGAHAHVRHPVSHGYHHVRLAATHYHGGRHYYGGSHVIQCVAFARSASDVDLSGNARDWWYNAEGRYARGSAPEPGSVLNFRPIRRMPLGHVAVVTGVTNSRVITIDQSHWGQSGVSRNVTVVDVSPDNDWSAVRVALNGREGTFGSIYPTYGFIYARGENEAPSAPHMMTASAEPAQLPAGTAVEQYAEATDTTGTIEEGYVSRHATHSTRRRAHYTRRAHH
ncbi:hypothetical protein ANI02nite_11420 [Acetobacter nitrogenifigens DSM 23921 = NBRC 105050]|uniref:Peptidase C51 domain-containing protein n=2 Tax=Acetobacter nitrogenifigens TaxID=285268 RepID=A0A511X8K7_9PROT|nr:hypothetical protein ANI02nite_11420 [Acetobacter nitrogenifigens DSM 23921 = NBRC 105050]